LVTTLDHVHSPFETRTLHATVSVLERIIKAGPGPRSPGSQKLTVKEDKCSKTSYEFSLVLTIGVV
jgi:hypothetical protein